MFSNRTKYFLMLCLSMALMAFLFRQIYFQKLLVQLQKISLGPFLISTVLAFSAPFILAVKYKILTIKSGIFVSLLRITAINFICRYFAMFIPSAIGADIIRWYKITKGQPNKGGFATLTIAERLVFVLLQFIAGVLFLSISSPQLGTAQDTIVYTSLASIIGLSGLVAVIVINQRIPHIRKCLQKTIAKLPAGPSKHVKQMLTVKVSLKQLLYIFILSAIWLALYLIRVYLISDALDLPLSFSDLAWMSSIILLIQIIPISLAGIGVREASFAYVFTLYGQPADQGALLGLLISAQMIAIALVGGLLHLHENYSSFRSSFHNQD